MIYTIPTVGITMATESDWGRIYRLDTPTVEDEDSGLVMPIRSYYFRDFNVLSWTDIAIGMVYKVRVASGDHTHDEDAFINESLSTTNIANLFHFGLSRSNGSEIDISNNPLFLGFRGILGGTTQILRSSMSLGSLGATYVKTPNTSFNGTVIDMPLNEGNDPDEYAMFGIRFTLNQVTGTVHLNYASEAHASITFNSPDLEVANNVTPLRTFISGISNSVVASHAQFTVASVTQFRTFYVYWPYILNRLKLHGLGVIKFG